MSSLPSDDDDSSDSSGFIVNPRMRQLQPRLFFLTPHYASLEHRRRSFGRFDFPLLLFLFINTDDLAESGFFYRGE